ncbi:hypothetical protein [Paraburkholderia flagellata]|nr:hypothetical protein [Paraburkholderia flagellata]
MLIDEIHALLAGLSAPWKRARDSMVSICHRWTRLSALPRC